MLTPLMQAYSLDWPKFAWQNQLLIINRYQSTLYRAAQNVPYATFFHFSFEIHYAAQTTSTVTLPHMVPNPNGVPSPSRSNRVLSLWAGMRTAVLISPSGVIQKLAVLSRRRLGTECSKDNWKKREMILYIKVQGLAPNAGQRVLTSSSGHK